MSTQYFPYKSSYTTCLMLFSPKSSIISNAAAYNQFATIFKYWIPIMLLP